MRAIIKLSSLPYGLVMVSHSTSKEMKSKTQKWNKWTVDVGGKNGKRVLALADIILFMDSEVRDEKECGIIKTKPSSYWEAGDKSTLLPEEIIYPLKDPKVAYDKIFECFNKNGQSTI